jgi:hypothetical protein
MDRIGHFAKPLLILSAQHTKTVTGYHGFNRDNDAIVMGCGALSTHRPAAFRARIRAAVPPHIGWVSRRNRGLQYRRRHG